MRRRSFTVLFVILICALLFANSFGRDDKRTAKPPLPFEPSEELVYEGELSRSLLRGINVAELRFKTTRTADTANTKASDVNTATRLHFTVDAISKGVLIKLFGLNFRQHLESTVEPSSFSVLQTTKLDVQGKRQRTSEAVFDQTAGKVIWTERDPNDPSREPRVVTNELKGAVQDLVSVFYFLRTQPLAVGQNFEVAVSDSGQVYRVPVRVIEKKKMKTLLGEVQTLRVEPQIFGEGRLLRGKGTVTVWFTDDARHIPVRGQIKSELGTLDIKLKRFSNDAPR